MNKMESFRLKWNKFWFKAKPVLHKTGVVFKHIGKWLYRLRGFVLSIPLGVAAIIIAVQNNSRLPAEVGIDLQTSGEFATMISRDTAVWVPLTVTGICIALTCCSRRVLYPWLIGVFSLVIPFLLYYTNVIPF